MRGRMWRLRIDAKAHRVVAAPGGKRKLERVHTTQWRFALEYLASVNRNRRTVSNECGSSWLIQCLSELLAVKSCNVRVQFEAGGIPNFPSRMFHTVFAAAFAERSVTPVMFGDKFGARSCWNRLRLAGRRHF